MFFETKVLFSKFSLKRYWITKMNYTVWTLQCGISDPEVLPHWEFSSKLFVLKLFSHFHSQMSKWKFIPRCHRCHAPEAGPSHHRLNEGEQFPDPSPLTPGRWGGGCCPGEPGVEKGMHSVLSESCTRDSQGNLWKKPHPPRKGKLRCDQALSKKLGNCSDPFPWGQSHPHSREQAGALVGWWALTTVLSLLQSLQQQL